MRHKKENKSYSKRSTKKNSNLFEICTSVVAPKGTEDHFLVTATRYVNSGWEYSGEGTSWYKEEELELYFNKEKFYMAVTNRGSYLSRVVNTSGVSPEGKMLADKKDLGISWFIIPNTEILIPVTEGYNYVMDNYEHYENCEDSEDVEYDDIEDD